MSGPNSLAQPRQGLRGNNVRVKSLIVGCDPGTAVVGYGVLEAMPDRYRALAWGVIRTEVAAGLPERLRELHRRFGALLDAWRPDVLVVEELLVGRKPRTALATAHARGVIMLAAAQRGVQVRAYAPTEAKLAVAGYGAAAKGQVQFMVKTLLGLPEVPEPDDAADALALALCHAHRSLGRGGALHRPERY